MEGKFKILACTSCRHKACAKYIFHGLKSPSLSPANYLNETNCIFFKKIPRLNQFQNFRFSSNDLRIALRHFAGSGIWNPAHISSPKKLREQCYRLIRQGRLSVISRPYHTNELKEFREWATREPHKVAFLMGSLYISKKAEEKIEEAAVSSSLTEELGRFSLIIDFIDIQPGSLETADDKYTLRGSGHRTYEQTKNTRDDLVEGDGMLTVRFNNLVPDLSYSLEVDPGAEGKPYLVFEKIPFEKLKGDSLYASEETAENHQRPRESKPSEGIRKDSLRSNHLIDPYDDYDQDRIEKGDTSGGAAPHDLEEWLNKIEADDDFSDPETW